MTPKRIAEYEFSKGVRITHWLRALSIFVLLATGYYMAYVFIAPEPSSEPNVFLQAKIRFTHLVFGFLLIGVTIFKTYLFLFDKKSRAERVRLNEFVSPKIWLAWFKYFFHKGPKPEARGVYNIVQFRAYFVFYIILAVFIISGLILYMHVYHNGLGGFLMPILLPVESWVGGLSPVRTIHHICAILTMLFVVIHVYLVVFNTVRGKEGTLDAIVSGYKYRKEP